MVQSLSLSLSVSVCIVFASQRSALGASCPRIRSTSSHPFAWILAQPTDRTRIGPCEDWFSSSCRLKSCWASFWAKWNRRNGLKQLVVQVFGIQALFLYFLVSSLYTLLNDFLERPPAHGRRRSTLTPTKVRMELLMDGLGKKDHCQEFCSFSWYSLIPSAWQM